MKTWIRDADAGCAWCARVEDAHFQATKATGDEFDGGGDGVRDAVPSIGIT